MSDWSSDVCSSELRRLRQLIDKFDVFRRLLARQPRIANDRCDLRQIEGVASADHDECADRFRSLAARHRDHRDLVHLGRTIKPVLDLLGAAVLAGTSAHSLLSDGGLDWRPYGK